jgi:ubiquitin C-terminal hydrolase
VTEEVPEIDMYNGMELYRICNDSIIGKLFHGESCVKLTFHCGAEQFVHEPLASWAISLPQDRKSVKLEDCITAWQQTQLMIGENGLLCDECSNVEDVQRSIQVVRFAPVVIVQLKRISQHGSHLSKNTTPGSYPLSFQTAQWAERDTGERHLTGVIHHSGSLEEGHYTCFVRDPNDWNLWYNISDSWVSQVSRPGNRITDSTAMTLIYQKEQ